MAVSGKIPCLDVVRRTGGNLHRNRVAITGARLRRFHQKWVAVLFVAGGLEANQDQIWRGRRKETNGKDDCAVETQDGCLQSRYVRSPGDCERCLGDEMRLFLHVVHGERER